MPFKDNWESTDQHSSLEPSIIEGILTKAFPNKTVHQYHLIKGGGCANLNLKVELVGEKPFILRIYLRDPDAAYREQKIALLVKDRVPAPAIYFIGDYANYRFAVVEYKEGIQLRRLLLGQEIYDIRAIMYDVGALLARLQSYQFQHSGFFNKQLEPIQRIEQEGYIEFAQNCLSNAKVRNNLDKFSLVKIAFYLEKNQSFFPKVEERNLVHADFDPANILVIQENGNWKISAILDWEFAFSGSSLCDLANMLRYAHMMPPSFTEAFLNGLKDKQFPLPKTWQTSIHMLNLVSLLDCLQNSDPLKRPKQCQDICSLIYWILKTLEGHS